MSNERKRIITVNFLILAIGAILLLMAVDSHGQERYYYNHLNVINFFTGETEFSQAESGYIDFTPAYIQIYNTSGTLHTFNLYTQPGAEWRRSIEKLRDKWQKVVGNVTMQLYVSMDGGAMSCIIKSPRAVLFWNLREKETILQYNKRY